MADLKGLRRQWYDKIKKTGFRDIENERGELIDHRGSLDILRLVSSTDVFEATRDYFLWASHQLQNARFESPTDRQIWALHADGKTSREIEEVVDYSQSQICVKIKKIRQYLQVQEVRKELRKASGE